MRKYLVFLLLSCFTISCTQQENINNLIKKAEQGDVEAQFNLGYYYHSGEGVEQSEKKLSIGGKKRQNKDMLIHNIIWALITGRDMV